MQQPLCTLNEIIIDLSCGVGTFGVAKQEQKTCKSLQAILFSRSLSLVRSLSLSLSLFYLRGFKLELPASRPAAVAQVTGSSGRAKKPQK